VTERDVEPQRAFRGAVEERLAQLLPDGAALCLPTAPGPAPPLQARSDDVEVVVRTKALSLLCVAGLGDRPQLTMPLGTMAGCPIGLSIVGARGSDRALLAFAASLQP
jgi:amidase